MKGKYKILLVDDEPTNLKLLQQVLKHDYKLIFANNGEQALIAAKMHQPNLILLDVMMPNMTGYEVCEQLKLSAETEHIPVIFVTAMGEMNDEAKGFDAGAVDYIQKPISAPIVLRRVQTHLSLVSIVSLETLVKDSVHMLGEAGHYNDTDTGEHIWRMADYSVVLAKEIGWEPQQIHLLALSAPMHDMGKIGIPDSILKAPRKLTAEEWSIMQTHSRIGYGILNQSQNPVFKMAAEIALSHHEKWDGSGYPQGLKGEEIPISARIVAVVDVFDALTVKRPYKDAWSIDSAMALLKKEAGLHFDPQLISIFKKRLPDMLKAKTKWSNSGDAMEWLDPGLKTAGVATRSLTEGGSDQAQSIQSG
ncbi:MAG: response regulator [Gammaproteobacteria bacterium]|nr:response regulator [Gammaproteobacteria bacterium]